MTRVIARSLVIVTIAACSDATPAKVQIAQETGSVTPTAASTATLDSLVARGESSFAAGEFDSARAVWRIALEQARSFRNHRSEARILTSLGLVAYRKGEYAESRSLGESALAIKLSHGFRADLFKSYNGLALLAWNQARLSDALALFERGSAVARENSDEASLAKAANNVGLVQQELGNFAAARSGFEEGRRVGHRLGDARIEARSLSNMGMLESQIGDPASAIATLISARALYRTTPDRTGEQNTLGQLGFAYQEIGEPRLALAAFDSALAMARSQGLRQEEASNLELIAGLHREVGRFRQALELYRQANSIDRELGLDVERGINLRSSAQIQAALGRSDLAKANAKAALQIHRSIGARLDEVRDLLTIADVESGIDPSNVSIQASLAEARQIANELAARIARAEVALGTASIADRAAGFREVLRGLREAGPDIAHGGYQGQWLAAAMMARAYAGVGLLDSAAIKGREAVAALERVRGRFGSGVLRESFASDKTVPYSDLVDVLLRLGRVDEAFEVSDASRSRALLENLLASREAPAGGGFTVRALSNGEPALRRVQALVARLDAVEETSVAERNAGTAAQTRSLLTELAAARTAYEELMIRAAERDAAGSALLGSRRTRARDVQRFLHPGEALLEYLVAADRLTVFVVTADSVRSVTRKIGRADLSRRVRIARDVLEKRRASPIAESNVLAALYADLVDPAVSSGLLRDVHRLIVVPHASLSYLPFAALRRQRSHRYLVEDYAILHLPSAAALVFLRSAEAKAKRVAVETQPIAFAPFDRDLPGSAREARAFARAIASSATIIGSGATERRVREALSQSGIVHIASHGVMNQLNPMFSRIELAASPGGPADDGRLEVHEVLALRLNAPLIFLSGCETGLGTAFGTEFTVGEDYATLAQAFLYAGAGTVGATLWRIGDDGAAVFAERFYSKLATAPPAEALASAQRSLIRDQRFGAPYYWAGYQLSGVAETTVIPHKRGLASVER
jgi:CHAT domain-containing protein